MAGGRAGLSIRRPSHQLRPSDAGPPTKGGLVTHLLFLSKDPLVHTVQTLQIEPVLFRTVLISQLVLGLFFLTLSLLLPPSIPLLSGRVHGQDRHELEVHRMNIIIHHRRPRPGNIGAR